MRGRELNMNSSSRVCRLLLKDMNLSWDLPEHDAEQHVTKS